MLRMAALLLAALACPTPGQGSICVADAWDNGAVPSRFVFPNWASLNAASFEVLTCDGCDWQTSERLASLTVVNFGNASASDIKTVYWQAECGATSTGLQTMTYRGNYAEDSGTYPAWTWTGPSPTELSACTPMWAGGPGYFTLNIYVDIASCPNRDVTVQMGLPVHSLTNTSWWGSMWDNAGCAVPWTDLRGPGQTILYVLKKASTEAAAPGDTISYTIYYGKPGTAALTQILIMDTQPPYTHYLAGTGNMPDSGWDPNPGPPVQLRWTMGGSIPVTGGPTDEITFSVSIDWGNGEGFEPGSGDIAAPEGARLDNQAQVFFSGPGMAACPNSTVINPPVTAVVRRFLMWKVGDNDVLFSSTLGLPADEMTYSIYLKNVSETKTWWNVTITDTVPAEMDAWAPGCGIEDPCVGWTMTPWGCPYASAGRKFSGPNTILTWRLDMPPGMTLSLRWRARLRSTVPPDTTVLNRASVLVEGRTGIVDGTGHSGVFRNFTHEAPVILPTTYTSYIGIAAADDKDFICCNTGVLATQSYWISFFPLNKRANFSLYRQEHYNDAWAQFGGASPTIASFAGDCVGGGGDWIAGCKAERAPAFYRPVAYAACPAPAPLPFHNVYKLTSNSPLLWELSTGPAGPGWDNSTYVGTTSLTYSGFTSYTYARVCIYPQYTDGFYLVNTSTVTPTTVHVFKWNALALDWQYIDTGEINSESQWFFNPPEAESYKVISSDSRLIFFKGYPGIGVGGAFNDQGTQAPNRENGYLVSGAAPASFYAYAGGPATDGASLAIGNVGAADATYEIWEYFADNPTLPNPTNTHLTTQLLGSSGSWKFLRSGVVPWGQADPGNPYVFGNGYDTNITDTYTAYRVDLVSGGPIQVYNGRDIYSPWGSGCVIHSVTPPTGTEYWFHLADAGDKGTCASPHWDIMTLDFYCSKAGTKVTATDESGYTASFTTPGPDSCVSFKGLSRPANGTSQNYRITSTGGLIAVGHQIHCQMAEKLYTAPFLSQGLHYRIIVPPVVYLGQNFWITVVVVESGGTTKTDYDGVTSFTSTDTQARIEGANMDGYDYNWMGMPAENGVRIFFNVSFSAVGLQTIVAQDTLDGSINGLATLMVVAADVKLTKEPRLTIASSGEAIQFRICWSNYSSATAANFVITDAVPMGTTYIPEAASLMFCGAGGPDAPTVTVAYGGASATTPAVFNTLTSPTQTAPASTRWLRWTIQDVYVYSTGCVCFRVRID